MSRPFRFAVQSYTATSPADWLDQARRAEDLGYATFHTADHHIGPGPALDPTNHGVQYLSAVPAIAAAAAATTTIGVGCRVFCTDYRNPVVFAKELASLDVLSGGRLEVGLGCGWMDAEYEAMGIPFDRPGTRIARMEETIRVLRAHFGDGLVDVVGDHVHASGFEGIPHPTSPGGPPLMIGGGSPRVLAVAGREADIVSINFDNRAGRLGGASTLSGTAERTDEKIGWVRDAAGDRFDGIELEIAAYMTAVTDDRSRALASMAGRFDTDAEVFAAHAHVLAGSVAAICEQLEQRRERFGITYITVADRVAVDFAPVVAHLAGT